MKNGKEILWRLYVLVSVLITVILIYIPLSLIIIYSFNSADRGMLWQGFSLRWYFDFWNDKELLQSLYNSFCVAALTLVFSFTLGVIQSYVLISVQKWKFIFFSIAAFLPVLMPDLMIALPLSFLFSLIGVHKGILTIALAQTIVGSAYVGLIVTARLRSINFNSYRIVSFTLGASDFQVFVDHYLPLALKTAAISAFMVFLISFQDYLYAFFCGSEGSTTLAVKTFSMVRFGPNGSVYVLYSIILLLTWISLLYQNSRNEKN